MAKPSPRTIIIIGGGFSGTGVAVNLLRQAGSGPLHIVLVESARIGRGVAYADRAHPFLLNVPAGRMSATSGNPAEFVEFARRRLPESTPEDFLPRALYGEYLESLLASAEMSGWPLRRLQRVQGRAIAIEKPSEAGLDVYLEDGRVLLGDAVVLACGNPPPASLPALRTLEPDPRYVLDPWAGPGGFRPGESVLVIGTGLTMADIVLAGMQSAHGEAVVHAISRHGLIPPPQTAFRPPLGAEARHVLMRAAVSTRRLLRAVRTLASQIRCRGGDWREAVTLVRGLAPALWQQLPLRERRRFLRHVQTYWDIHRHRLAEQTAGSLDSLRQAGRLQVHAGRVLGAERCADRLRVHWRARGEAAARTLTVDRIVNCTGPDYDVRRSGDPLLRSLLTRGMATADELGLGLQTDECGALIDSHGQASAELYYLGPMLRATDWETTAAAELRDHAERLARHLVLLGSQDGRAPQWRLLLKPPILAALPRAATRVARSSP